MSLILVVGNAANTAQVLSQHRHRVDLVGTVADAGIAFPQYDWLHFAGGHPGVLAGVLAGLQERFDQVVSLGLEKPGEWLQELLPRVDIAFFAESYALQAGFRQADAFLQSLHKQFPETILGCQWGGQGAYALGLDGELLFAAAHPVLGTPRLGGNFNAGMIHALATGGTLGEALDYALGLPAGKVAQQGPGNLP